MKKMSKEAYAAYVKEKTPVHNVYANMAKAFVTGGTICLLGQVILNYCKQCRHGRENRGFLDITGPCIYQCFVDRSEYLSKYCKMGWCRSTCADYRICQFRCCTCD